MENLDDEQLIISHFGAIKLQSVARMILVRSRIIKQLNERYEKIYDPKRDRYYYYDIQQDKSSWRKPPLLLKSDILRISPPYVPDGEEHSITEQHSRIEDVSKVIANGSIKENDGVDTDDEDHKEEGEHIKSEEDASESDYSSEDSEAVRDRRRLKRKYPR